MQSSYNPEWKTWMQRDFLSPKSTLSRNTAWMLLGQGAKLVIQAIYFVLMARNLGAHQYGAFVAVTASASIVSPFVGNGTGFLMIKNVARDHNVFAEYFGNSLLLTLLSGAGFTLAVAVGCLALLAHAIPGIIILQIVISDVLVYPFVQVAAWAFQSLELLGWTAGLTVFASFSRLAGIAVIVGMHRPTLLAWSVAYLLTSTVCAVVAVACVLWRLGRPRLAISRIKGELREGFYFSTGLSAQTVYNDMDKTMLARLSTLDATGIYAAAYRLIDVAFIPIRSLLAAAYPGFFRSGHHGIASSLAYAKSLLPRALAYSAAIALALLVAAPLVPKILGAEYARTTEALRWLALLPLLKTIHYFAADSLTGAGFQGLRTLVQVLIAVFNVALNFWIIPAYGWRGAAWSSLASDGLLAISLCCCAAVLRSREQMLIPASEVTAC